jgi:hypothetical protein
MSPYFAALIIFLCGVILGVVITVLFQAGLK